MPKFTNVPLREAVVEVALEADDAALIPAAGLGRYYGDDEGAALRDILFSWWEKRFLG